jgi:hypothetical protein
LGAIFINEHSVDFSEINLYLNLAISRCEAVHN